jgi:hypothetical protein
MDLTLKNLTLEQLNEVVKTLKKAKYETKPIFQTLDGEPEPKKPKE